MSIPDHIAVIDPAIRIPELDSFNHLLGLSPLPLTYHLPAMFGMKSLDRESGNLRGIVLFGSASSVNERLPWQPQLESWVKSMIEQGVPTFGCCYGHQMLAHMFGGKVIFRRPDKEKLLGFREVELEPNPLWGKAAKGKMCVSHNEMVTEVPSSMQVIAKSKDCAVDGLAHKTLPVWSFQPHPEATSRFAELRGTPDAKSSDFSLGYSILRAFLSYCATGKHAHG